MLQFHCLFKPFACTAIFSFIINLNTSAQCALAVDSVHSTNVTCNGLSNGSITVFSHGAHGSTSYSSGGSGSTILAAEPFNSNIVTTGTNGSTSVWWGPNYQTPIAYVSSGGCTGGAVGYSGSFTNYWGNFLRSPEQNCTGNTSVVLGFDITNSYVASHIVTSPSSCDGLRFYVWDNNFSSGSHYYNATSVKINGVEVGASDGNGMHLKFDQARSCVHVNVTIDFATAGVPNINKLLFYIEGSNPYNDSYTYSFKLDNISVSGAVPSQSTNVFTWLAAGSYSITLTDSTGCTVTTTATTITQPNAVTASITAQTNVACHASANGSATVTPYGGNGTYTYQWGTTPTQTTATATGLTAGIYSVTVNDGNNCSTTTSTTITEPIAITTSITNTSVSCHGGSNGSSTVTASGGTGSYTYQWNTTPQQTTATATGLAAGAYTVTVKDANNCVKTASATVTQPATLALTLAPKAVSANGLCNGADTAHVTGGNTPYNYSWTGGQSAAIATGLCAGNYCLTVLDAQGCTASACDSVTQPAVTCTGLSVTAIHNNVSCNGSNNGTITVTATGGNGVYQYTVNTFPFQTSNQFTNLVATHYTIYVHDSSGCSGTDSLTITQPTALNVILGARATSAVGVCDGSDTAHVSGGNTPYSFTWNPATTQHGAIATNLCSGNYCVTVVDGNGCTIAACNNVNQPGCNGFTVNAIATNTNSPTANDGKDSAIVQGGHTPYVYNWSNGGTTQTISNTGTGYYCVTVVDSVGCQATICDSVKANPSVGCNGFAITSLTGRNVKCFGGSDGSATVIVSGGTAPYSFNWGNGHTSDTINNLAIGTYQVTVIDTHSCSVSAGVTITESPALTVGVISTSTTSSTNCNGSLATVVNGGTPAYSYLWNTIPAQTTATASNLCAGNYCVTITDANQCSLTKCDTVSLYLGINNLVDTARISIFPNPATESVNISTTVAINSFTLFNIAGIEVLRADNIDSQQTKINVSGLSKGIYLLQLNLGNEKIIKRITVL